METFVHIGLFADLSGAFGRGVCRGAARFVRKQCPDWRLIPCDPNLEAAALPRWLAENRIAGMLVDTGSLELFGRLAASGVPLVNLTARHATPGVTSVLVDEAAVARLGADFLLTAGFRHFAYCGDDDVLCSLAVPALSSIATNDEEIGHAAAQTLAGVLNGSMAPGAKFRIQPGRVVERHSTGIEATEDPRLFKCLQLIRDGVSRGISVDTLCREAGCSRPTLDGLFKECLGRTVSEEIIRVRLQQVTEQLRFTDLSLEEIARMFNFPSRCRFSQFVKKWGGMTALEVRRGRLATQQADPIIQSGGLQPPAQKDARFGVRQELPF